MRVNMASFLQLMLLCTSLYAGATNAARYGFKRPAGIIGVGGLLGLRQCRLPASFGAGIAGGRLKIPGYLACVQGGFVKAGSACQVRCMDGFNSTTPDAQAYYYMCTPAGVLLPSTLKCNNGMCCGDSGIVTPSV